MLNENAKKWVAALRSGEYKQGKGYLCANGNFCCLGVASDLYAKEHLDFETKQRECEGIGTLTAYGDSWATCPIRVQRWLGLRTDTGANASRSLVSANDTGTPFSEIADLIESEPEGLFV